MMLGILVLAFGLRIEFGLGLGAGQLSMCFVGSVVMYDGIIQWMGRSHGEASSLVRIWDESLVSGRTKRVNE
ncbi:hypothetical protein F5X98DRAFT_346541 [Xylaria grammica]|nr:hypothetical protein F5X98DRAFT_346541 [Xylaria grammica]